MVTADRADARLIALPLLPNAGVDRTNLYKLFSNPFKRSG
jgi:hypothetical protein